MHERNVILTWEAIYDIVNIIEHIEITFGINRANRFQKDIRFQMKNLEIVGGIFGKTDIYYRNYSIYKMPFPPSIIFYIIKEPQKEIHVLRVLREEQDWKTKLTEKQSYTYPNLI